MINLNSSAGQKKDYENLGNLDITLTKDISLISDKLHDHLYQQFILYNHSEKVS